MEQKHPIGSRGPVPYDKCLSSIVSACPPCTGDCNEGRACPAGAPPVYHEVVIWHHASDKPPLDQDVLITFEGSRGAYIGAWMGSENGWVGVDALPVDRVAWWAVIPPGPAPAMSAAASGLAPEPAR